MVTCRGTDQAIRRELSNDLLQMVLSIPISMSLLVEEKTDFQLGL